ncbi:MAG: nucleotidyltransferase [Acidobacteria bacterium]|nr:nucleotidyltransferase [Acidobacteriota bacterium]
MNPNSNFSELLRVFDDWGVKYLLVGGYALMHYTEPRYTKDIDLWVEASPENSAKVFRALAAFGAPLRGLTEAVFQTPDTIYQMGRPPLRVDVLTSLSGVAFADCWERRVPGCFAQQAVWVIALEDLIANKRAVGRTRDLADVEDLEAARGRDSSAK